MSVAAADPVDRLDLLADSAGLVDHLLAHQFPLGVGDELRLVELRRRLADRGAVASSVAELCRVVSPLVCRNPDQQERLPEILRRWVAVKLPEVGATAPDERRRTEAVVQASKHRRWLTAAALGAGAAVLLALCLWLLPMLRQPAAPAQPAPAPAAGAPTAAPAPTGWKVDWRLLLALAPLVAAGAYYPLRPRTPALTRGMAPRDAQKAALRVALTDSPLFRPGAIRAALRDLRRHRLSPSDEYDGARSVAATVEAGGFVRLVKARRPVLPDYILLIDRLARDDHLGELAQVLTARLHADQFRIVRGEFRGDPRIVTLVTETGRERRDLEDLAGDYPDARLLLIADVASFWDPVREDWRDWVGDLQAFGATAVMSPTPRAQWGVRERELAEMGFLLTPATSDGLVSLADQLRAETRLQAPRETHRQDLDLLLGADPYRWSADKPPPDEEVAELLAVLQETLGPAAFLHLCAVAVFPTIHPRLTEQIGQALTNADGVVVLSEEGYAALSRLPWMRRGRIPDWLRRALLLTLKPGDAERVRAVWTRALEPMPVDEASALDLDVVKPRPADKAVLRLLTSMIRNGQAPPEMSEALLLAFLEGRPLPELGVAAPRRLLDEGGLHLPRPEIVDFGILLLAAALGAGLYVLAPLVLAWAASRNTALEITVFFSSWGLSLGAVAWRMLRGPGWRPVAASAVALALAALAAVAELNMGLVLAGLAATALVWVASPPFWSRHFEGLQLRLLFSGDVWDATCVFAPACIFIALAPFAWALAEFLTTPKTPQVLKFLLASAFSGVPITMLAGYFAERLLRRPGFATSVGVLFSALITMLGVSGLLAWAMVTATSGDRSPDMQAGGVDLALTLPLLAVFWFMTRETLKPLAAAGPILSSLVCIVARDAMLGAQPFGAATPFAVAALTATPAAYYAYTGGRSERAVALKALACVIAVDVLGATVLALASRSPDIVLRAWPLAASTLPIAAIWPALRWTRPELWTSPKALAAGLWRMDLSPWSLAFLLLSPTYTLGDFSVTPGVLAVPLVVFLAQRHHWRRVRAWAALGAAPLLIGIGREGLGVSSDTGLYLSLLLLPRLVGKPGALQEWLQGGRLSLMQIAFLLIPLGLQVAVGFRLGSATVGFSWSPLLLQTLLLFLVGLSEAPLRGFWLAYAPVAIGGIAAAALLPQSDARLYGLDLTVGLPMDSIALAALAAVAVLCGRALRPGVLAERDRSEGLDWMRVTRPWLFLAIPLAMMLMVVTLGRFGYMESRLLDDAALLCLAPLVAFNAGRLGQIALGATAIVFALAGVALRGAEPRLGPFLANLRLWDLLELAPTALAALLIMELVIRVRADAGFSDDGEQLRGGESFSQAVA
jgi:hypothetical protein